MTTRYKKERMSGCSKRESVHTALTTSIHSVLSSALGFFAATIGVGIYSDVDLIGSLCLLMARGANHQYGGGRFDVAQYVYVV